MVNEKKNTDFKGKSSPKLPAFTSSHKEIHVGSSENPTCQCNFLKPFLIWLTKDSDRWASKIDFK